MSARNAAIATISSTFHGCSGRATRASTRIAHEASTSVAVVRSWSSESPSVLRAMTYATNVATDATTPPGIAIRSTRPRKPGRTRVRVRRERQEERRHADRERADEREVAGQERDTSRR